MCALFICKQERSQGHLCTKSIIFSIKDRLISFFIVIIEMIALYSPFSHSWPSLHLNHFPTFGEI